MGKPEILAPAGDFEKLRYAVAYGADAVYLSGKSYGMRTASGNFTEDELRQAVAYCHARGVKCFVTVNVMPRSDEIDRLPAYFELLEDIHADAVIIADLGGSARCLPKSRGCCASAASSAARHATPSAPKRG